MRGLIATVAIAVASGTVLADVGTVRGVVEVTRAKDVAPGAILVYLVGFTESATAKDVVVKQQDRRFVPELVALTAGQTVTFPNGDPFMHNVFSATAERSFDLGSFSKGDSRSRTFPSPGVIEVYCNIHPEMSAIIVVLPNRKFVTTDANGHFEITDVPPGTWSVFAVSRRAVKPARSAVTVTAGGVAEVKLAIEEVQRDFSHHNKYGETYRKDSNVYADD